MQILIHDYAGHPFPVELSRALAQRGHVVCHAFASQLLTPRGELLRKDTDSTGLSFKAVSMSPDYRKNKYSFIKRLGYERAYGKELVQLIDEIKPDVIISGQTPSDPQWAFTRAAHVRAIPMVTWVQDFYSLAVDKLARKKLPLIGALAGWWLLPAISHQYFARLGCKLNVLR
jgi:colanic acid biosynthesis glycosyl transferase WcaI